jgi:adenosine deaminase
LIDPSFPLIELHRHLDGNVRLQTILELGQEHHLALPAQHVEGLRSHVQITDPKTDRTFFNAKFPWTQAVMVDYQAIHRIAYENVEDAKKDGLDYVELRFSPWFMAEAYNLKPEAVAYAVAEAVQAGQQDFAIKVNLIGCLNRTYGPNIAAKELAALLTQAEHICAIDLCGDEANFPAKWFREHFRRARAAGWHITIHAGETAGADSVWEAICGLGAERVSHALCAIDDPALMDFMLENKIGLECCLTSNVKTGLLNDYSRHPVRRFLEKGLLASLNTDNPGLLGIDLPYEYSWAAPKAGLVESQIQRAQANALETAFLTDEEKQVLIKNYASKDGKPDLKQ